MSSHSTCGERSANAANRAAARSTAAQAGPSRGRAASTRIGLDAVRDQVARTDAALGTPPCVRPPFGSLTASIRGALEASGKHVVMWDVDTRDWSLPGAPAIAERIVAGARPGAIILLHDGGNDRSQTLAGVDHALGILAAAGWRFDPVPGC